MTYIFENDRTMMWVVDLETGPDTVSVPYRVNYQADPVHLLGGKTSWEERPLTRRFSHATLYLAGCHRSPRSGCLR